MTNHPGVDPVNPYDYFLPPGVDDTSNTSAFRTLEPFCELVLSSMPSIRSAISRLGL